MIDTQDEQLHHITNNVSLYINDANNIINNIKNIDFIYMDPPYDTNRDFTLDSKNDTAFAISFTVASLFKAILSLISSVTG